VTGTSPRIPFRRRIAYKQARDVVLIAFTVGFLLSLVQVYFDFRTEAQSFDDTIKQVVNTVHQPAARAAYNLEVELAEEVARGLFEFRSIIEVSIHDSIGTELTHQLRSDLRAGSSQALAHLRWISEAVFGGKRTHEITLKFAEDTSVVTGFIRVITDPHVMAIDFFERSFVVLTLGLVLALILAALLSVVFYFLLAKPLSEMSKVLSNADPNQPELTRLRAPERNRDDEIDILAESVNSLLRVIGQRNLERDEAERALIETSQSLEITVKIRTAELEATVLAAEAANLAKSNFLSTMSHEIRTPLNGVLGLAQLLTDTDLDKNQQQKVDTILSSGQTLLAIINDVLDMSKIEAGGIELEHSAFSLGGLISTVTTPFQSLADDKGLRLLVKDDVGGLALKGDPLRLRQILWNLLSNAIKFTDEGSVTLAIEQRNDGAGLVSLEKAHVLHFAISDSGAGIAPDRLDAIFDAFTQEDSTITRKHGGSGLGLSIVKQLTELMGGTITAESRLGEGATFNVYLPFDGTTGQEAEAISMRKAFDRGDRAEPLNVLIAEDNEVNALIAKSFLEKFGHRVKHVENGKLAVAAAAEGWADLILMDVHMPEMNGIDATKAIRQTASGTSIPIVGLTAEAFAERHVLFRDAGMNGVLTKPFTEQQLADTLATHRSIVGRSERYNAELPVGLDSPSVPSVVGKPVDKGAPGEKGSDADKPVVGDEIKLDEFRQQLGQETVSILLNEAQTSLQTRLTELKQSVRDENSTHIREAAHSIKGASGSLFAVQVADLAAQIEHRSEDLGFVQKTLPDFEIAAQDALEWWRQQALHHPDE